MTEETFGPREFSQTALALEHAERRVVEPTSATILGFSGNPLEAKAELSDDAERSVIVGRRCNAHAVSAQATENPSEQNIARLRHETLPMRLLTKPVTEVAVEVHVLHHLEPDHAEERARRSLTDGETTSAPLVPIERTRLRITERRILLCHEGHPRKPRLEKCARRFDRRIQLACIDAFEWGERNPSPEQRRHTHVDARRNGKHEDGESTTRPRRWNSAPRLSLLVAGESNPGRVIVRIHLRLLGVARVRENEGLLGTRDLLDRARDEVAAAGREKQ